MSTPDYGSLEDNPHAWKNFEKDYRFVSEKEWEKFGEELRKQIHGSQAAAPAAAPATTELARGTIGRQTDPAPLASTTSLASAKKLPGGKDTLTWFNSIPKENRCTSDAAREFIDFKTYKWKKQDSASLGFLVWESDPKNHDPGKYMFWIDNTPEKNTLFSFKDDKSVYKFYVDNSHRLPLRPTAFPEPPKKENPPEYEDTVDAYE